MYLLWCWLIPVQGFLSDLSRFCFQRSDTYRRWISGTQFFLSRHWLNEYAFPQFQSELWWHFDEVEYCYDQPVQKKIFLNLFFKYLNYYGMHNSSALKLEKSHKNSWNQINQFHEKKFWPNSIFCIFKMVKNKFVK